VAFFIGETKNRKLPREASIRKDWEACYWALRLPWVFLFMEGKAMAEQTKNKHYEELREIAKSTITYLDDIREVIRFVTEGICGIPDTVDEHLNNPIIPTYTDVVKTALGYALVYCEDAKNNLTEVLKQE